MKFLILIFLVGSSLSFCTQGNFPEPDARIALWKEWPLPDNPYKFIEPRDDYHLIKKVQSPSIEYFAADNGKYQGVGILIFPGGGYTALAYDREGTEIAEWLNELGISTFILRYTIKEGKYIPLRDAQRAMGIIRQNAERWSVNPDKLGVLGFSAGGHLAAMISTNWRTRMYEVRDESDLRSPRPDFAALVYPAYISKQQELVMLSGVNPDIATPPSFIVHTKDDKHHLSAYAYDEALKKAGTEVETHIYESGGHGFGIRKSGHPSDKWQDTFLRWLDRQLLDPST